MAFIKKEPIVEFITKGLNNPDKSKAYGYDAIEILTEIEYSPTAEVEEVKHGEWIRHKPNPEKMREFHKELGVLMGENSIYWTCSICGSWGVPHDKRCRECGAKMDGQKQEEKEAQQHE